MLLLFLLSISLFLLSISVRVLRWVLMPVARPIVGMLLLFLLSFSSFPVAQSRSDARLRFVSVNQGETIVQAAWELRRGLNPKPDCSHFIQAVYAKAGFVYDYANTREIFTGIDSFRRVQHPQPGDLVVWQGHMGIVIDPGEHSFYSSVLSGFAIENYQSNYWQARGYPRFYRFVVKDLQMAPRTTTRTLRASAKQVHPASDQPPAQQTQRVPVSVSSQKPGMMTTATVADSATQPLLRPASSRKAGLAVTDSPKAASPQPVQVADSPKSVSQQPVQITDLPKKLSRQPAQIAPQPSSSGQAKVEASAGKTAGQVGANHDEVFVTSAATPSRREVLAAITWYVNDNGERLLRDRLLDSQASVSVADHFTLVSLDLQGNSGLAEVEVKEIAGFQYGKPAPKQSIVRQRVILSRQEQGWMLLLPQDLMYLSRRTAVVALNDQLATLSKTPADQLQAKKTSKILRELLAPKSPAATPGGAD